jgi:N4-gp56 family major capsid protein
MATTSYGVNHPLAVKLWSRKLFHEMIGMSYVGKFTGTSDSSLIQMKTETQKGAGDKITFGLRNLLAGAGIQGDNGLEGNEEALVTYNDAVTIDQLRHAVRSAGRMSEQRVPFSVREEARMGLQDWWIERLETSVANQLTGNTGQADTKYTGNQATIAPSTNRLICGAPSGAPLVTHTTEASLSATTTHAIKLQELDKAVALAKAPVSGEPRIRPISVDGKKMWVAFLHPYQIYQLRRDSSTAGNFYDVNKAMLQGGKISDNPIVTGASFIYNNVIVHEWDYLPTIAGTPNSGAATDYRRGVFCGAQALVCAYGQNNQPNKMSWEEELFDYGNQLGVAAGCIFGVKKSVFNSVDFGTIVLSGYAPTP